ncbi:MAG: hypothetical protein WB290_07045 [Smithella sp.]
MLKQLKEVSKIFLSTLMHNILAAIVVGIIGIPLLISWVTGTLDILLQTLRSPTQLWQTILLVFLSCLLVYLRVGKSHSLSSPHSTGVESNNEIKNNNHDQLKSPINDITLDDTAVNILRKLWKFSGGLTDISISKILELDLQIAKYHLEKLEKQRMVHGSITVGEPRMWSLIHKGREYLIEKKLNS